MTTEIVSHEESPKAIQTVPQQSPMEMMTQAMAAGATPEYLSQMMDVQFKWEANEARKAYVAAMAEFKANPPKIVKSKKVSYKTTHYSHADLGELAGLIGKGLGEVGISASWDQVQLEKGMIKVTCTLTHSMGHSESTSLVSGADATGSKNSIQAIGSTNTYLQRYTLLAITGLAAQDQDDDGMKSEPVKTINEKQISQVVDMMNESGINKAEYFQYLGITSVDEIQAGNFNNVMADLNRALERKNAK